MPKKLRSYTKEYRTGAVQLALSSDSVSGTAKSLGIPEATLYSWVSKAKRTGEVNYADETGVVNTVNVSEVLAENERLKKQLLRLEQEKAILKKAATYFAKELG